MRRGVGFGGSIGAIALFCLSLTPSLLPRHWALQGVLSGVTTAIGYAVGAAIGGAIRTLWPAAWPRLASLPRWAWHLLAGAGGALALVFLWLGEAWQRDLRQVVGVGPGPRWGPLLMVVTAAGVFTLLLAAGRAVRLATRRLARALARFSPRPVASVAATGVVLAMTYGLGQGVVITGFGYLADQVAEAANGNTASGVARPTSRYVSGGPGSLVSWDTLGLFGREFTAGAVPRDDLVEFVGADQAGEVRSPIRVYVGRDRAETAREQAQLAVRELERTGAFDRAVIAVVMTTGRGLVNPAVPAALEYMYGGDSAVVATQYSYLPSWILYFADRSSATQAAATLIGAVRERLATMPADERPAFVVYGESLGAHGIEAAFGGLDELADGTDGALLVGPPHTSPIWLQVTEQRDPDSPVWLPSYRGDGTVRFGYRGGDLAGNASTAVGQPQIVYLQNPSDPVVWWSPELLYREPEWLDGARGPGVPGAMHWLPAVTFCQVMVDGFTSSLAPPGHGHRYHEIIADAWAALIPPARWAATDTTRLHAQLASMV